MCKRDTHNRASIEYHLQKCVEVSILAEHEVFPTAGGAIIDNALKD